MNIFELIRDILSTPAILLGTITLLGLLFQKKPKDYIIKGTITTIVGYTLLSAGSSLLQNGALKDFGILFNYDFHIQGVIPNMEAISSLGISQYGIRVSEVMVLGMVANLILARFSSFRYIFLTGHHTLYMACLLVVVFSQTGMEDWQVILSGSMILGLLMSILPSFIQKDMNLLTKNDKIAYGHFSVIGCLLAGKIARLVRKRNCEIEGDIKFNAKLSFMKDSTVCIFIVMSIVFFLLTGFATSQIDLTLLDISYDPDLYQNWIIYAITQGALFSASIYIILAGVRMMVAEIVPAFKGFAKKIVPNAKPAVDCPIVFPYTPNAVMIGFLMSFLGGVVVMLVLISINTNLSSIFVPVIVPGVVSHFFCGGSAGAFANAQGGTRGCVIGSFIHGIFISVLSLLVMPLTGGLNLSGTTFSDSDFCLTGILFGGLSNFISSTSIFIICIILFLIPILFQQFRSNK